MSARIELTQIGVVSSALTSREHAPKQGHEGSPEAWLTFEPRFESALADLCEGEDVLVLTWLHRADRSILQVHPRDDEQQPLHGVFSTRSQDRPNPIGVHRVTIVKRESSLRFKVSHLEAFDGTPIVDVKAVLDDHQDR